MDSLKQAMKWDEEVYGREYDLDLFNIVAVSDFNMGAMENKSLNIFNTAYVLADQETATDGDFDNIARRGRARIFPQLVGRPGDLPRLVPAQPQGRLHRASRPDFSADMGSEAVKRIEDVRICARRSSPRIRAARAPRRPDSYIEISNFYTATVYNKGAEVIRMMRTTVRDRNNSAPAPTSISTATTAKRRLRGLRPALEDAQRARPGAVPPLVQQAGTPRSRAAGA